MKTVKSFAILIWLFLPTIILLFSCTSEYHISKTELAEHSNFSLIKVKMKSGQEYECNIKFNPFYKNNKLVGQLLNGENIEYNLDDIESLLIKEGTTLGALGFISIVVISALVALAITQIH